MKRSKEQYQETIPVMYYQKRELQEQLEKLNQEKLLNDKMTYGK